MWKKARCSLLLGAALFAAAVTAQNSATGSDVLVTMPINIDGSLKDLQLMRGESFEAAATSFARTNGLMDIQDDNRVREVIDELSGLLKDKMTEIEANAPPSQAVPSVQLSFPLTVDTYTGEMRKYEGESVEACVERFLYETGFNMDVMRELFPKVVEIVNQKLAELQPARKEILSFELTIDGAPAVVRHFDDGNPMEEAILTLRSVNINEGELMDRFVPQIANAITQRLNDMDAAAAQQQQSQQQQQAPKELFSIPLTIGDQPAVLVHVDGLTTRESAMRFLNSNGITDPETVGSYLSQLVGILDNRMSEYIRDEAAATMANEATPTAPTSPQVPVPPARKPLLTLPINLGDNRSANLEYYEGDSIERTVELFLQNVGLVDSPSFSESLAKLTGVVRQHLTALQQEEEELMRQQELAQKQQLAQQEQAQAANQATRPAPIISLPVTLSGQVYDLEYFEGQEVGYVANTFCVEKHEIVRAELGVEFDGNQLQECKNVLVNTLNDILAKRAQEQQGQEQQTQEQAQAQVQDAAPEPAAAATDAQGDLLFTLDIDDGEGGSYQLPFYRNDDVRGVATAFCQKYALDLSNVPALMEGIQAQLA